MATLQITKETLQGQRKKGMPFERVGEKEFFHIQDILDYYRKVSITPITGGAKEKHLTPLGDNVPKEIPILIIDGYYNFNNQAAGSGLILIENREAATGVSNVRKIVTTKPHVSELLALLDGLKMMKKKKFNKAIIVTDQKSWSNGITIDVNSYEGPVKTYLLEFNQLWTELKGKVVVKYVGEMNNGKKNLLFQKAHSLSREYVKGVLKEKEVLS